METGFTIGDRQEGRLITVQKEEFQILCPDMQPLSGKSSREKGEYLNWQMKHEHVSEIEPYAGI